MRFKLTKTGPHSGKATTVKGVRKPKAASTKSGLKGRVYNRCTSTHMGQRCDRIKNHEGRHRKLLKNTLSSKKYANADQYWS
jgi:hypothetical protein